METWKLIHHPPSLFPLFPFVTLRLCLCHSSLAAFSFSLVGLFAFSCFLYSLNLDSDSTRLHSTPLDCTPLHYTPLLLHYSTRLHSTPLDSTTPLLHSTPLDSTPNTVTNCTAQLLRLRQTQEVLVGCVWVDRPASRAITTRGRKMVTSCNAPSCGHKQGACLWR